MYINRTTINGRLTEEPIYKTRKGVIRTEEYAILKCHTEKPIKIRDEKSKEDIYFEVLAFGNNASSIKGRVFKGTPLLFELEIRNFDTGDGRTQMVLQAVKIHFHERAPRRIDMSSNEPVTKEIEKKEEPVTVVAEVESKKEEDKSNKKKK